MLTVRSIANNSKKMGVAMAKTGPTGPYYYQAIDEAIELYLRRKGMTQAELAAQMGMSEPTFSWKRRGVRDFTLGEASRLCNLLDIALDAAAKAAA